MKTALSVAPLSSYLAAIGLLKIIGEQMDPEAVGFWESGRFILDTHLSIEDLSAFLVNEYEPSPLITPWNKDCGFFEGKPHAEFQKLEAPRFAELQRIVHLAINLVPQFVKNGSLEKEAKIELFEALDRAGDSDAWSAWLGTCGVTFRDEKGGKAIRFPALLGGTGGAFGKAVFGRKFIKALQMASADHFKAAILGSYQSDLLVKDVDSIIYDPANRSDGQQGYDVATRDTQESRSSRFNPAYLILLAEGMALFEGFAMTTAFDGETSDGDQQAGFTLAVQHNSSGYASSSWLEDKGNQSEELWCPLWDQPCHYSDVRDALRRITLLPLPRQFRTGTDFALFASRLGRRLNLSGFARYAFPARVGKGTKIPSLIEVFTIGEKQDDRSDALARVVQFASRLRNHAKNKGVPASYRQAAERLVAEVEVVAGGSGSYTELLKRLIVWRRQEDISQQNPKRSDKQAFAIRQSFEFCAPVLPAQWFDLLANELEGPEWRLALALGTGKAQRLKSNRLREKENARKDKFGESLAQGRPYASLVDVLLLLEGRLDAKWVDELALGIAWIERRKLPKLPIAEDSIPWLPADYLVGLLLHQWQFQKHVPVKGDRDRWRQLLLANRPEEAMAVGMQRLQTAEVMKCRWPVIAASNPKRLLEAVEVRIHPITIKRLAS